MGWKNVKDHYRIGHCMQVNESGICIGRCIGSDFHNMIVIGMDGAVHSSSILIGGGESERYLNEMDADPELLRKLVLEPDTFMPESHTVYTYVGDKIVEEQCEQVGYPNMTHVGHIQHENTYSTDKVKVVEWAKRNAAAGVEWRQKRIEEACRTFAKLIAELESGRDECAANLAKLKTDYP